jgi:cysteine-rich repeat protein
MTAVTPSNRTRRAWWNILALAAFVIVGAGGCTVDFTGPGNDCGDGVIQDNETCDDSNSASGDGCGASCQVEDGWTCAGEPSFCETTCGDGVARGTEACDRVDLRSLTCDQLGLGDGALACDADTCAFDTTGCDLQSVCGNGAVESSEECDGDNLVGETCQGLGLASGALACSETCEYNVDDCTGAATCGNTTIEYPEVCDGASMGGQDCTDYGYYSGFLVCDADCEDFDPSGCTGTCGDGVINGPEVCDTGELGGQDCTDHGFYGGSLVCDADCAGFDSSGCTGECGDGVANGPEDCDDTDLGGTDCVDLGHYGGALTCDSGCGFDESACHLTPRIVINEVAHGWPDTVELLNLSAVNVNLQGWVLEAHDIVSGNPHLEPFNLPFYLLGAGQRVLLVDEVNGTGGSPTVNQTTSTIQFHVNVQWSGGLVPGAAGLIDDGGDSVDFVRWGDSSFAPPVGTGWADTPNMLLGQSNDGIGLSRVPDGVDTDTAADFCVARITDTQPNGACLDPAAGSTVLITEIDISSPDALEVHNVGPGAVDLEGWTVYFYDDDGPETGGSSLPSYVLAAGDYVEIVEGVPAGSPAIVNGDQIRIHNISWTPPDAGGCGLVDPAGNGRDFVRWGQSAALPWTPDLFTDQPSQAPMPGATYNLARANLTDTDTAADWCLQLPTLGSPNGAGCF